MALARSRKRLSAAQAQAAALPKTRKHSSEQPHLEPMTAYDDRLDAAGRAAGSIISRAANRAIERILHDVLGWSCL
jgi:hypothetical protein